MKTKAKDLHNAALEAVRTFAEAKIKLEEKQPDGNLWAAGYIYAMIDILRLLDGKKGG